MRSPKLPPSPPNRTCTCTSQSMSTLQTSTSHQHSSGSSTTLYMATGLAAKTQMAAMSTLLSLTFRRWAHLLISGPRLLDLTNSQSCNLEFRHQVWLYPQFTCFVATGRSLRSLGNGLLTSACGWSWTWSRILPTTSRIVFLWLKPVKD